MNPPKQLNLGSSQPLHDFDARMYLGGFIVIVLVGADYFSEQ